MSVIPNGSADEARSQTPRRGFHLTWPPFLPSSISNEYVHWCMATLTSSMPRPMMEKLLHHVYVHQVPRLASHSTAGSRNV